MESQIINLMLENAPAVAVLTYLLYRQERLIALVIEAFIRYQGHDHADSDPK
jgi:hypothetical protein